MTEPAIQHSRAHTEHHHPDPHAAGASAGVVSPKHRAPTSVLGWPAWLRVLAVLPVVVLLWLAVAWANAGVSPW